MGKLFLVRHGETTWNAGGRIQGHMDIPLSQTGRRQADCLAARLRSVALDAAYTSDLARCAETAQALVRGREVPLQLAPDLRELSYGDWQGKTDREVQGASPEAFARFMTGDLSFAPPGGESVEALFQRVGRWVVDMRQRHAGEGSILVVGHGGSLRAVLVTLLGLPAETLWRFNLANCGLSVVSDYGNTAVLELWNDTGHLRE